MPLRLDEYDGVCVATVTGDLAGETEVAGLRGGVGQMIDGGGLCHVVVDCEKVPFVDSGGLEALLWIKRKCEDRAGQFKLAAVDDNVRKVLDLTRLLRRFDLAADVPAALKGMR